MRKLETLRTTQQDTIFMEALWSLLGAETWPFYKQSKTQRMVRSSMDAEKLCQLRLLRRSHQLHPICNLILS